MNLGQLEVFVAIVDSGSLLEAAEVVGLTQSAVSHSLRRLESELGVTLLERGRQGISVTRIGEDVLKHARLMLAQAEIIRQKTARERGLTVGKVRFGCVPNVSPRLLTGIIRDFQHRYPDIDIALFEGSPLELVAWLENGVIDVGTVIASEQYAFTLPLAQDEVHVIVSGRHPLATRSTVTLSDLADQALIAPKDTYRMLMSLPILQNIQLPRLRYDVSSYNTIYAMVRENLGVAITPSTVVEMQTEGIVTLTLQPQIAIRVSIATTTDSPVTQAFIESAHRWAKSHGFLPDFT